MHLFAFAPQKMPIRRPDIPENILKMKDDGPEVEEEEEEEQEMNATNSRNKKPEVKVAAEEEMEQEIKLPPSSPCKSKNLDSTRGKQMPLISLFYTGLCNCWILQS